MFNARKNITDKFREQVEKLISEGRHYFWSNFPISDFEDKKIPGFIQTGTVDETQRLKDWLGIQYEGNIYYGKNHCPGQVLRNCVHPDLGLHIFNCALNKQPIQNELFAWQ